MKIEFNEEEIKNIYKYYFVDNMSFRELHEIYGCSATVFHRIFNENGWTPHKPQYKNTLYSVNEHFFDKIDTPDKAYCLGLFYADGCNLLESNYISIELQANDYDVLNSINNLLENTSPVKIYSSENKTNRKLDTCRIRIRSEYLCNRLNELNFIPRKSLTLDFPYWMDDELIPYMLRGYIDGDGWVQKYRIGFMSTDKFCKGVKKYFDSIGLECHIRDMKRKYNEHTKTFDINGRKNIIPFVEKMFSGGTIFMDRKVKKYIEFGFLDDKNNSLIA